jgi:NAD(P)-dependent dehydrogenase (short-subunit alcohol dehydrogenase family)
VSRPAVTGAASGIGRATALLLLERGSSVVAADRDEAGLAVVADASAEPVVCDITDPADRARLGDGARPACDQAIVNVSSGAGKTGSTYEAAVYGASKAAVLSITAASPTPTRDAVCA